MLLLAKDVGARRFRRRVSLDLGKVLLHLTVSVGREEI
jgi:hypothetical protein